MPNMTTHASPSSTQGDRPERSRNAKAQARHRAKRKAYIEQLEQTVTKLQSVLALTPEQVAALPPPSARIRQLEQENDKLLRENDELRRQLHLQSRRASLVTNDPHFDIARRTSYPSASNEGHGYDRDLKRRRMSQSVDDVYLVRATVPRARVLSPLMPRFTQEPQRDPQSPDDRGHDAPKPLLPPSAATSPVHVLLKCQHLRLLESRTDVLDVATLLNQQPARASRLPNGLAPLELDIEPNDVLGKYFFL
ncbi:hypothetical protein EVG20_g4778 [Dentipellis fragilis]|uniref:BZIP domain-containing protein n=1 Tax=Dentipellis fragilis TaxID=205917 RepID=A0A4Y9YX83_9AGAM|nr:hypothetical protein EVG20_g4778 [Dentipellis fragilis]